MKNAPLTSKAALEMLDTMLEDMRTQEEVHQPTAFWNSASESILKDLKESGFTAFRALSSARSFFVPSYGPPGNMLSQNDVAELEKVFLKNYLSGGKAHMTLMHMLRGEAWAQADYRVFRAGDCVTKPPFLTGASESSVGNPPDQVVLEGRTYSRSFLNYLNALVFLKQQIDTSSIKSVLEVGGGYGTLGEILHQAQGGYCYVNVDIPPTSAVSSFYLSQQPDLKLIDYRRTHDLLEIEMPQADEQMVLCPWQLPRLKGSFDLFVNAISFQEMEPRVVQAYLDQVDRLRCHYVLLRNLREGKAKRSEKVAYGVETPMTADVYDAQLSSYDLVATNVIPFGYRTIDGFHSELRLYRRREQGDVT